MIDFSGEQKAEAVVFGIPGGSSDEVGSIQALLVAAFAEQLNTIGAGDRSMIRLICRFSGGRMTYV